jgi:hypothetical protein
MLRTLTIALVSLSLTFVACKKKEDKAADPAKTADPAGKATETTKPAETAPAAAGGDMEAKGIALFGKLGDIFAADAKDCEKLATDIKTFIGENKDLMAQLKEFDAKQTPEQKKAFDERNKGKAEEMMKKMGPAMEGCGSNANVTAAMKEMPM